MLLNQARTPCVSCCVSNFLSFSTHLPCKFQLGRFGGYVKVVVVVVANRVKNRIATSLTCLLMVHEKKRPTTTTSTACHSTLRKFTSKRLTKVAQSKRCLVQLCVTGFSDPLNETLTRRRRIVVKAFPQIHIHSLPRSIFNLKPD